MNFSAALTAAQAGKTISRSGRPGMAFMILTSASTAAGVIGGFKGGTHMLTPQGKLVAFNFEDGDYAATDWVAA